MALEVPLFEPVELEVTVFEPVAVLEDVDVAEELLVDVPVREAEDDDVPVLLELLVLVALELEVDVLEGRALTLGSAEGRPVGVEIPLIVPVRVVVELSVGKRLLFIPDVCVDNRDNAKIHNRISIFVYIPYFLLIHISSVGTFKLRGLERFRRSCSDAFSTTSCERDTYFFTSRRGP